VVADRDLEFAVVVLQLFDPIVASPLPPTLTNATSGPIETSRL